MQFERTSHSAESPSTIGEGNTLLMQCSVRGSGSDAMDLPPVTRRTRSSSRSLPRVYMNDTSFCGSSFIWFSAFQLGIQNTASGWYRSSHDDQACLSRYSASV